MKEQLEARIKTLQTEFESGQKMLADYEEKKVKLRESMLRISGAIQVLQEELKKADEAKSSIDENDNSSGQNEDKK